MTFRKTVVFKPMKRSLAPFLILLLITANGFAQGYRGRDFWVCFPENAQLEGNHFLSLSLFITAEARAAGSIENMSDSSFQHFKVEGGSAIEVQIDTLMELNSSEQIEKKSLHIVSDGDIMVYVVSHRQSTTDSYAAIPTNKLGMEYIEAGYPILRDVPQVYTSQAAIVATDDKTLVTVHLIDTTLNKKPKGRTLMVPLNRGETFLIQGNPRAYRNDLTGTEIHSTKPIAFFAGHRCAQVPPDNRFCDLLLEEEPPERDWGREFILTKFDGKDFSVARVIAGADSTEVSLDGKFVAVLARDSFYEVDTLHSDAVITTSKPALVAQYCTSSTADNEKLGDPFMLFVIPDDRFINEVTTTSLESNVFENYLNIVVPKSAESVVRIDRLPIISNPTAVLLAPMKERSVPGCRYEIITIQPRDGRHLLQCPEPIAVYSYGFGIGEQAFDSYGHACGMRLDEKH